MKKADDARPSSSSMSISDLTGDDDDQSGLITSLVKMIEKNEKEKSLQNIVMELTDKIHSTI
jgi:hypothetical protein